MSLPTANIFTDVVLTTTAEYNSNGVEIDLSAFAGADVVLRSFITTGTLAPGASKNVVIRYGFSTTQLDVGSAYAVLDTSESFHRIILKNTAATDHVYTSDVIKVTGDFLYVYIDHDQLSDTVTISTDLVGTYIPAGGGGGGGGDASAANQVTLNTSIGAVGSAAWAGSGNGDLIAVSKGEYGKLESIRALLAGSLTVGTHAVTQSGTWNVGTVSTVTSVTAVAGTVAVSGPLTDTQLRATAVPTNVTQVKGVALSTGAGAADTGTLRVALPYDQVPITVYLRKAYAAPSNSTIGTAAGDVMTVDFTTLGFIQNLATTPLYVKYSTGASTTSFNVVLKGGTAPDDGLGDKLWIDQLTGVVSVAGTSPRYIAWTAQQ